MMMMMGIEEEIIKDQKKSRYRMIQIKNNLKSFDNDFVDDQSSLLFKII